MIRSDPATALATGIAIERIRTGETSAIATEAETVTGIGTEKRTEIAERSGTAEAAAAVVAAPMLTALLMGNDAGVTDPAAAIRAAIGAMTAMDDGRGVCNSSSLSEWRYIMYCTCLAYCTRARPSLRFRKVAMVACR